MVCFKNSIPDDISIKMHSSMKKNNAWWRKSRKSRRVVVSLHTQWEEMTEFEHTVITLPAHSFSLYNISVAASENTQSLFSLLCTLLQIKTFFKTHFCGIIFLIRFFWRNVYSCSSLPWNILCFQGEMNLAPWLEYANVKTLLENYWLSPFQRYIRLYHLF